MNLTILYLKRLLIGIAALVLTPASLHAQPEPDRSDFALETTHLGGTVYLLTASNGESTVNMVASVGSDGVLLSDAGFADWEADLRAALQHAGSGEVRYLINTHYHSDHTDGNRVFAEAASVLAHPRTRAHLIGGTYPSPEPPLAFEALPQIMVPDSLSLHFNGERIDVRHAPGHTDGDLMVYFHEARVLHLGDLLLAPRALPYTADVEGLAATLQHLLDILPADVTVIPGHGARTTLGELRASHQIITETTDLVRRHIAAGGDLAALQAEELPAAWGAWNSRYLSVEDWIGSLYRRLVPPSSEIRPEREVLVVVNRSGHEVVLVDPTTHELVARLPTGKGPHEVTVSADGRLAYVANYGMYPAPHEDAIPQGQLQWRSERSTTLTVLDLYHQTVKATYDLGDCTRPHGLWVSRQGRRLWVTCEQQREVRELDAATGTTLHAWPTNQNVSHMVRSTPDDRTIFVANVGSGSLTLIDRTTGTLTTLPTGEGAEGLALSPDQRLLWVLNNQDDTISIVDVVQRRVVETFESDGAFPIKAAFTPDGKEVWVAHNTSRSLAVYDAETRTVVERIDLGTTPLGLFISPDGRRVYVSTPRRNEVQVYDVATRRLVDTFRSGIEPDGLAWGLTASQ